MAAGHSYNYTLTVKGKQLISTESGIGPWENGSSNTGDAEEEIEEIANNQIWYTTKDNTVLALYADDMFGVNLASNVYENGKGVMTFDGDLTSIVEWAFIDDESLTSITMPNSVTTIEESAFAGCLYLTNVTISNNVKTIGVQAFSDCSSLNNITIPNSVTTIADCAFVHCTSFTNITIPNSVTSIGEEAFQGCTSLAKVVVKAINPPTLSIEVFDNCSNDLKIFVPAASLEQYKNATNWKNLNIIANN